MVRARAARRGAPDRQVRLIAERRCAGVSRSSWLTAMRTGKGAAERGEEADRWGPMMSLRFVGVVLMGALGLLAGTALAQDPGHDEPGQFDFYVLSLSWSPSFCDAVGDRGRRQAQCANRPYAFVVHGLWPQYERGFPQGCQVPPPALPHSIMTSMLDLMPAPQLIYHEWDEHGTCSGLEPGEYFDTVRKARAAVKVPAEYSDLTSALTVSPDDVTSAFVAANAGLTANSVVIECDKRRLREVRICLTKDLAFRECPNLARRTCRRAAVTMPPVRGGTTSQQH
jgi:ribonuclease T2